MIVGSWRFVWPEEKLLTVSYWTIGDERRNAICGGGSKAPQSSDLPSHFHTLTSAQNKPQECFLCFIFWTNRRSASEEGEPLPPVPELGLG